MIAILHLVGFHTWVEPVREPEVAWCRVCGTSRRAWLAATPRMLYSQRHAFERMGPRRQALHLWLWNHRDRIPDRLWRLYRATWPSIR